MARVMKRQGDVLIVEASAIPSPVTRVPFDSRGRMVLAVGEHRGIAHVVEGDAVFLQEPANQNMRYLTVGSNGARVTVGDDTVHKPIQLPPGDFQVIRQVEADPASPTRTIPVSD